MSVTLSDCQNSLSVNMRSKFLRPTNFGAESKFQSCTVSQMATTAGIKNHNRKPKINGEINV